MPYKISLIRINPALGTADAMHRALADMEQLAKIVSARAFRHLDPADRARFEDTWRHREMAASALQRADAQLKRAEIDVPATAVSMQVAEDDVHIFEPVLLRSDDLHVEMTGDGATIVVEHGTRDEARMRRVWRLIETFAAHGYNAFDPQAEESIVPSFGFDRYNARWALGM